MSDTLSELLALFRARSVLSGGLVAGGDWGVAFPATTQLKFWGVRRGRAWIAFEGEAPIAAEAGDVFLFRAPGPHVLASSLSAPRRPLAAVVDGRLGAIASHGEGDEFMMIGGKVELEAGCEPLLFAGLPDKLRIPGSTAEGDTIHWVLERLVREREAMRPGWEASCAQLVHLMFIEILRACMGEAGILAPGWLRAAADPRLAPALRRMHGDPGRKWRLPELAAAAAMSRAGFARHFREQAGIPPLAYLGTLRMQLARRRLREGGVTVAQLAHAYGYGSESAFSHAFKRLTGVSPRQFGESG